MSFTDVSILAIILSGISNTIIGALWYSPLLFSNIWLKGMGKKKEELDMKGANLGYLLNILASFISAYVLSIFINAIENVTIFEGALVGFLAGFGIAVCREISPTFFEGRRRILFFISAGYHMVALTVMGIIIAAFSS
jgi:Protein of unknown function (DUF1761)